MTDIYLGVDAGGTKTHALLADAAGRALALGHAGPGNWEYVGLDFARDAFRFAIDDALRQARINVRDIAGAAFGLAGLDWPSDEPLLAGAVEQLGLPGEPVLVNDMFVALRAGTVAPWGVVVIAGTGCNKAGRNRAGETARTLGLHPEWGDWGGGMCITQAGVGAVAQAYIGLGPPTLLSETLVAQARMPDVETLLRAISREGFQLRRAAHLVFEAAAQGDDPARAILRRAGCELAKGANLVIRKLGMEDEAFDLVLAGGLFKAQEPLMRDTLVAGVQETAPDARPTQLMAPPAVGGVLLAMEADGLAPDAEVHARLLETTSALEGA